MNFIFAKIEVAMTRTFSAKCRAIVVFRALEYTISYTSLNRLYASRCYVTVRGNRFPALCIECTLYRKNLGKIIKAAGCGEYVRDRNGAVKQLSEALFYCYLA